MAVVTTAALCYGAGERRIPDHMLYEHFFDYVLFLNDAADNADRRATRGKPGDLARFKIKTEVNLSAAEDAILKRIGKQSNQRVAALREEIGHLTPPREQWGKPGVKDQAAGAKRDDLWRRVIQTMDDGIQELKIAFGDQRFQVLDGHVRTVFSTKIRYTGPTAQR